MTLSIHLYGWTDDLHSVRPEELLHIRWRRARQPAGVKEELFDGARRLINDHQLARIADIGKRMGDFARGKYRVARLQSKRVLSNLEQDSPSRTKNHSSRITIRSDTFGLNKADDLAYEVLNLPEQLPCRCKVWPLL